MTDFNPHFAHAPNWRTRAYVSTPQGLDTFRKDFLDRNPCKRFGPYSPSADPKISYSTISPNHDHITRKIEPFIHNEVGYFGRGINDPRLQLILNPPSWNLFEKSIGGSLFERNQDDYTVPQAGPVNTSATGTLGTVNDTSSLSNFALKSAGLFNQLRVAAAYLTYENDMGAPETLAFSNTCGLQFNRESNRWGHNCIWKQMPAQIAQERIDMTPSPSSLCPEFQAPPWHPPGFSQNPVPGMRR